MFLLMGEAFKSLTGKVGKVADYLAGEKGAGKGHYTPHSFLFLDSNSESQLMQKTSVTLNNLEPKVFSLPATPPPSLESTSPNLLAVMHISG